MIITKDYTTVSCIRPSLSLVGTETSLSRILRNHQYVSLRRCGSDWNNRPRLLLLLSDQSSDSKSRHREMLIGDLAGGLWSCSRVDQQQRPISVVRPRRHRRGSSTRWSTSSDDRASLSEHLLREWRWRHHGHICHPATDGEWTCLQRHFYLSFFYHIAHWLRQFVFRMSKFNIYKLF